MLGDWVKEELMSAGLRLDTEATVLLATSCLVSFLVLAEPDRGLLLVSIS